MIFNRAVRITVLSLFATLAFAADPAPPGAPGIPHRWAPALKQAVGTAYEPTTANSPLWFTIADGIITEIFYPTIDIAQVGDLQFLVTDGLKFFSEQKRDTVSDVRYAENGMTVLVSGRERGGRYSYEQEILTDARSPVVRIRTRFKPNQPGLRIFILFKPAIQNAGGGNLGSATSEGLFATREDARGMSPRAAATPVHAALVSSTPWLATSAGFVGTSDGWQDLSRNFRITRSWRDAGPGNVALVGEVATTRDDVFTFELALAFGPDRGVALARARTSLATPFAKTRSEYDGGWESYVDDLQGSALGGKKFLLESAFARRSAQLIKAHEDKTHRGAIIAGLSKPSLPEPGNAGDGSGGYHLVWPRDLYHAAMGLLAAGDTRTPIDVLRFLRRTQLSNGSWYQNFWIDGSAYWKGLQMDEVAFPILLAAHLERRGVYRMTAAELEMIRRAAEFILTRGPYSPQDRWEEIGGFIPSTIAAEIAALKEAARFTGDTHFLRTAREWQATIEHWTFVDHGLQNRSYYLRTSPSGDANNRREWIEIANGGGGAWAHEILDGGFLELVRQKLRGPFDAPILRTLEAYESQLVDISTQVQTDAGPATQFRRYNRDAYGDAKVGGYWPLLAGERGHYSVMAGDLARARAQLRVMELSALPSGVLPEQIISMRAPAGLGVACPLVWAHAEDILLHRSIEEGEVFDAPQDSR